MNPEVGDLVTYKQDYATGQRDENNKMIRSASLSFGIISEVITIKDASGEVTYYSIATNRVKREDIIAKATMESF